MKIQTILRAQDVTRWNIVHTVRKQSLAEHLFNTAALASYICHKMGRLDLVAEAVSYALLQDIDEVTMPDITAALGIPLNTGYSRLRLARAELARAVRALVEPPAADREPR